MRASRRTPRPRRSTRSRSVRGGSWSAKGVDRPPGGRRRRGVRPSRGRRHSPTWERMPPADAAAARYAAEQPGTIGRGSAQRRANRCRRCGSRRAVRPHQVLRRPSTPSRANASPSMSCRTPALHDAPVGARRRGRRRSWSAVSWSVSQMSADPQRGDDRSAPPAPHAASLIVRRGRSGRREVGLRPSGLAGATGVHLGRRRSVGDDAELRDGAEAVALALENRSTSGRSRGARACAAGEDATGRGRDPRGAVGHAEHEAADRAASTS